MSVQIGFEILLFDVGEGGLVDDLSFCDDASLVGFGVSEAREAPFHACFLTVDIWNYLVSLAAVFEVIFFDGHGDQLPKNF